MKDKITGATLALAIITVIWVAYEFGFHAGATEVRMDAIEHDKGHYSTAGDNRSKFIWFK